MATFTAEAATLVETYFKAWAAHDISLLEKVFAETATYSINGTERFRSLAEIRDYWQLNAVRQGRVKCSFKVTSDDPGTRSVSAAFLVRFFGTEENALVAISGSGTFFLDEGGQCTSFTEHYLKETSSILLGSILARADGIAIRVTSIAARILRGFRAIGGRLARLAYPALLIAYVPLLLFSMYMNFLEGTFGRLFRDQHTIDAANKLASASFAFGFVTLAGRDWLRRSPNDLLIRKRVPEDSMVDLDVMCREMRNASTVMIHSGDFSFISRHARLSEVLYQLARRGNLTLISYKDQETVLRSAQVSTQHIALMRQLIDGGMVRFDAPERAKFSVVVRPGGQAFLFRYDDGTESFVATLSATNAASRTLVDTVLCLTRSLLKRG